MYQVRLLDVNRRLLAVLPAEGGSYSRKASEATDVRVTIPRPAVEAVLQQGQTIHAFLGAQQPAPYAPTAPAHQPPVPGIAHYLEVWDGTRRLASGIITDRALGETTISLSAKTEEVLLERHRTPAQYGPALSGLDLADFARALLYDHHTVRVKAREQWEQAIERVNVDTATMPGMVLLAKDANGAYLPDGYIVLRFRKSTIPGFVAWDRIRWLSDHKPPVSTSVQYRYGPDEGSLSAWSAPVSGGLPDTVGLVPGTADAAILDVRINLHTDDTTSEDPNGQPVGYSPRVYAVEVIARTEGQVAGDYLPATTGVTVRGLDADDANALELLRQACEQAGWEFWVDAGQLYLAKQKGTDRTNEWVLREGTNCTIDTLSEDDSELVNILDAYGPGDGINRMHVHLRAEDSIALHGPRHGSEEFPDAVDLADLTAKAQQYLDSRKWPVASFEVQAAWPWGEEPAFEVGDTVKVVSPRSGAVTTTRIMEESRSWGSGGVQVQLRLGRPRPSFVRAVLEATGQDEPPLADELPAPLGFRVESAQPGVKVWVNPFPPGSRAIGVEIHAGITQGFEPSTATLVAKGPNTQWHLTDIPGGQRWWFVARAYDGQGNYSPITEYVSAVAGYIPGSTLDPGLQEDIAHAVTQAAVVEANAAVWDKARLIDKATLLTGTVTAATANTITDSAHDWASEDVHPNHLVRILSGAGEGQLRAIVAVDGDTLTVDPAWDVIPAPGDQFEVSSSARITSREHGSIVAKLNADAETSEFSSIRQTAQSVQSLVAAFEDVTVVEGSVTSATATSLTDTSKDFLSAGVRKGYHVEITSGPLARQLRVITNATATQITVDAPWSSAPAPGTTYRISSPSKSTASAITQRADEISSIVTTLNSDMSAPTQYSAIRQAASEIDLRVRADEVISAINLSPEAVKIQTNRLEIQAVDDAQNKVWFDPTGLYMQPVDFEQPGMKLSGRMLGFWDINNLPSIGLGDVREMAQQLGSTMEYGLLIAQGEIRASGAVLQRSLAPGVVESTHIAPGAVVGDSMPDNSIYPIKLSDWISVPDITSMTLKLIEDTPQVRLPSDSGWRTVKTYTVTKRDDSSGRLMESLQLQMAFSYSNLSGWRWVNIRVLIDGVERWMKAQEEVRDATIEYTVQFDTREWTDGDHTITIQTEIYSTYAHYLQWVIISQNNQLPIRFGRPQYSLAAGAPAGCYTNCQVTSQSRNKCGNRCEEACQSACKSDCETGGCQATCEATSQGGGGCIREGTPITVWDPETQGYLEVPVERLQPGMILPRYDPLTDTITHSRLVELRDAKYSPMFIRIHTDVGPSIDVTWEQPFDVLADRGQGERVYRLKARDLQPGMKLFRPFDEPGRRIATITRVETVKERPRDLPGVHFWWPITERLEGFIAHGYSDLPAKAPLG